MGNALGSPNDRDDLDEDLELFSTRQPSPSPKNQKERSSDLKIIDSKGIKIQEATKGKKITTSKVFDKKLGKFNTRTKKGHATQYKISDFKRHFSHKKKITAMEIDEKRKVIWTAARDKVIAAWHMNGEIAKLLQGHTDVVACITRVGDMLYSGSHDKTIRIWDISEKGGATTIDVIPTKEWVASLASDGTLLYVGYDTTNDIDVYNISTKKKVVLLKGHTRRVTHLQLDVDEGMLYSSSIDGTIRYWNVEGGICSRILNLNSQVFRVLSSEPYMVCALMNEVRVIEDVEEQQPLQFMNLVSYCFIDDVLIGFNRSNQQIEVWHMPSQVLLYTFPSKVLHVTSMSMHDSQLFYTSGHLVFEKTLVLNDLISYRDVTETELTDVTCTTALSSSIPHPNLVCPPQPAYREFHSLFKYFSHSNIDVADLMEREASSIRALTTFEERAALLSSCIRDALNDQQHPLDTIPLSFDDLPTTNESLYRAEDYLLDFDTRTELFYKKLQELSSSIEPTILIVRRSEIVFDTLKHFSNLSADDLRKQMYIFFAGEEGLDMGGVTKAFYSLLSQQILNPNHGLFYMIDDKTAFHPSRMSTQQEDHLHYFYFVGKLIGKALFDMQLLQTPFTKVLFKLMVGEPISFHDLQFVEPCVYDTLINLLKMHDVAACDLSFSISNAFGEVVSLIDDGSSVTVTDENKYEFVRLYASYLMYSIVRPQILHLLKGVHSIIPLSYFSILNGDEVKLLLCGSSSIDVHEWRENSIYEGFSDSMSLDGHDESFMPTIEFFWQVMHDFSVDLRLKVLEFVTGSACLPHGGWTAVYPRFTIVQLYNASNDHLPRAQTCINRLELPLYDSASTLSKKLLQAISLGSTFSLH